MPIISVRDNKNNRWKRESEINGILYWNEVIQSGIKTVNANNYCQR